MNDLRAELRGVVSPPVPEFAIVLPGGWKEFAPTEDVRRELIERATERLRDAHRPDLLAQLRAMTGRAFAGMAASDTLRFYIQTEAWNDGLLLPLSLTATMRRPRPGEGLDAVVSDLIRRKGATALHGDQRFVRWETESVTAMGTAKVQQFTTAYLTPIPGSQRTRALQFTAVAVAPDDGSVTRTTPIVESMFELTDAIVSTLSWDA